MTLLERVTIVQKHLSDEIPIDDWADPQLSMGLALAFNLLTDCMHINEPQMVRIAWTIAHIILDELRQRGENTKLPLTDRETAWTMLKSYVAVREAELRA